MVKVTNTELRQVLNINLGFRPGINFRSLTSTGVGGTPEVTDPSNRFHAWYQTGTGNPRHAIPGLGFVWNKYPSIALQTILTPCYKQKYLFINNVFFNI